MSFNALRLYELFPAIYRIRDAEQGEPLKALLAVIAEQVGVLEENLEQLYDDQFIETCADWVVPYIGDLIGYRALHNVAPKIGNQRAEVAHTIAFRRRKGTAAMLEQLARDVTNWDARAVEFFELLGWTQHMNHIRPASFYSPDLRDWEILERLDTPFDRAAHTVDVRRITTSQGKHNIPNIGIFLWRLRAYPLTRSPAVAVDSRRFLFDPLGRDMQLFAHPEAEEEITHLAEPINVPEPISRRVMAQYLDQYYGQGKSIFIDSTSTDKVNVCNLSDAGSGSWAHTPLPGAVAIDPVLGRIAFGDAQAQPPLVTFHYGFSADMGGGEYDRAGTFDAKMSPLVKFPGTAPSLQAALNAIKDGGAVEISDSGRYNETPAPAITVNAKQRIELRAANNHRPLIVLGGGMSLDGGLQSEVTLNGLVLSGGTLRLPAAGGNNLRRLRLQHCTLVPSAQPSLIVDIADVIIEVDHCITGGMRIAEGAHVEITDSIVDATTESAVAFAHADGISPGGSLQVVDSTVIGKVHTTEMKLVSNTIFVAALADGDPWIAANVGAAIRSEKKQAGCVRFSYLPPGSQTPRRYRCEPELEIAMRIEQAEKELNRRIADRERNAIRGNVESWLVPSFTALRYGLSGYAQLRHSCPRQIRTGAEDEAEMGAFHNLYQPQRETNLRVRLDEYLRFGLDAGIFYVT
jgi:hypothetical protein